MYKVVLVEDETVIREGIRDNIPWEEHGFSFVGEAGDGEMALSVIRQTKPDLLITDVKMPFMDGLSLCKIVSEEFPKMKIIIISGYDDFEYARQAINIGVDQYLLKPITKMNLKKALEEIREKLELENGPQDYQVQYTNEMKEYEQFERRHFFEKILEGEFSVMEIYDEAGKLGIDLTASAYNLLFFTIKEKSRLSEEIQEQFEESMDEIIQFVLRYPQYVLFRWNVNAYGVLVKAEESTITDLITRLVDKLSQVCESDTSIEQWYISLGKQVERLSLLAESYQTANHHMAYRFLVNDEHILSAETLEKYLGSSEEPNLNAVDSAKMNPDIIRDFLSQGDKSEIADFVASYVGGIKDALRSNMFRDYVVLNIRFTVIAYAEGHGSSQEELSNLMEREYSDMHLKAEEVEEYFIDMLSAALTIRDRESDVLSNRVLHRAMEYVDKNFENEDISLNEVAAKVNVSPSYLSTVFSQNAEKTFIEYVTGKRMEKAKKLLKTTDMSSGEIAAKVGYKDPHYFSFVFKKTQGMSARDYRTKKK